MYQFATRNILFEFPSLNTIQYDMIHEMYILLQRNGLKHVK